MPAHDESSPQLWGLLWPTVGAIGLLLAHGLVRWVYVAWYFVPAGITLVLWLGVLIDRVAARAPGWSAAMTAAYLLTQVIAAVILWDDGGMMASQRSATERWLPEYRAWCAEAERIGICDSGYAGYYLPCTVVNLDGVVNNAAFAAIVDGRFRQYLDEMRIGRAGLNDIVRGVVEAREGPVPKAPPFGR